MKTRYGSYPSPPFHIDIEFLILSFVVIIQWKDSNTAIVLAVKSVAMFHRKHATFLTTTAIHLEP